MTHNKTHGLFAVILALGFALVALAIIFAPKPEINVSTSGEADRNTIAVAGTTTFDVDPDQAEVYIRVKTEEPTAKRAQEENARLMSAVQSALKRYGISSNKMETTSYNLWPQQKWDPDTREYENNGFIAQHLLKVTTDDVTSTGDILDIAVSNGANGLDRVNFKLSDKKKEDVNSEALAQASDNAREKALAISQNLGLRLGDVIRVSESTVGYNYIPQPMMAMAESAVGGRSFDTEISPESVSVSANINLIYEIK